MKITDILKPTCVALPLKATEKAAAITELVDLLHNNDCLTNRDQVLEAVLGREHIRSTGIGLGLAVPHGKSWGCDTLAMAVGRAETPIEFDAVDGRPVKMLILLGSPFDKTGPHIQALASISRLWQNESFRTTILQAASAEEVYATFVQHQG